MVTKGDLRTGGEEAARLARLASEARCQAVRMGSHLLPENTAMAASTEETNRT